MNMKLRFQHFKKIVIPECFYRESEARQSHKHEIMSEIAAAPCALQ